MSPLPTRPPPDAVREIHEAYIEREANRYADLEKQYHDRVWLRLMGLSSFWWLGTCTGLSLTSKTATVQLDPIAGEGGPPIRPEVAFKWGRQTWTAGQIVGKRVRVGYNPLLNYGWIIDVVNHE